MIKIEELFNINVNRSIYSLPPPIDDIRLRKKTKFGSKFNPKMFVAILQLVIGFLCVHRSNGASEGDLTCASVEFQDGQSLQFTSDDNSEVLISRADGLVDSMKDEITDSKMAYAVCLTLSYFHQDNQWIGGLHILSNYTAPELIGIKNKDEGLSVKFLSSLQNSLADSNNQQKNHF